MEEVTIEQEETKVYTDKQLIAFMDGLSKEWKESTGSTLTLNDAKILWWFKHKILKLLNNEIGTRELSTSDKNIINVLNVYKFSIGDIAFVVNRSKSTVHDYLNRSP